jgi:hypothetical protein
MSLAPVLLLHTSHTCVVCVCVQCASTLLSPGAAVVTRHAAQVLQTSACTSHPAGGAVNLATTAHQWVRAVAAAAPIRITFALLFHMVWVSVLTTIVPALICVLLHPGSPNATW